VACHGNGDLHCCWIAGVVCPHLEEGTVEGRRWVCGLLRVHETWEAVYETAEYQATDAAAMFAAATDGWFGYGCGDFPQNIPQAMASPSGKCCWQEVSN